MRTKDLKDARKDPRPAKATTATLALSDITSGVSFSGHERDCLFLNRGGTSFGDLSGVSGLDDPSDGRNLAVWDYDRDGWPDIATTNLNTPTLRIYHNDLGSLLPQDDHRILAIRFVGGNRAGKVSRKVSARDGYGARVTVAVGETKLVREHRAGEGFAVQNSDTMIVGLGKQDTVDSVTVRWPSGQKQTIERVAAGSLLTVYEDPEQAPKREAFVTSSYQRAKAPPTKLLPRPRPAPDFGPRSLDLGRDAAGKAPLRLYVTMATWCAPCAREVSALQRVRAAMPESEVAMLAIPVDPQDHGGKLDAFVAAQRPPYKVLREASAADVTKVLEIVKGELLADGLPAAIVTDAEGHVLRVQFGAPTISELRALLARVRP